MYQRILAISVAFLSLLSCNSGGESYQHNSFGYAQGTTYSIKYLANKDLELQLSFDSILTEIDKSLSTYIPNSLISRLNNGDTTLVADKYLYSVLSMSLQLSRETGGCFDPTLGPLIEYFGFGKSKQTSIDSSKVDSILKIVGYEKIRFDGDRISIPKGGALNFNANAQGYSTDILGDFLESKGVSNYMIELGGEVKTAGRNIDGEVWRIGIDRPTEEVERTNWQVIITLKDKGLATSGNYRKFWTDEETGVRYTHTLDPQTGYPSRNKLLSSTVIANTGIAADAYATACMVMGVNKAYDFIKGVEGAEAYFIYSNDRGEWEVLETPGFEDYRLN